MRVPHPDDAVDFAITARIDGMVKIFMSFRAMTRSEVIAELCNGDGMFDHGLNAIAEMFSLTRHEINTRVSAFIEAEKEEEAERISRLIESALSREDAA